MGTWSLPSGTRIPTITNTVSEKYDRTQEQTLVTEQMLTRQASTAAEFASAFDRMIESGISVDLRAGADGKVEVFAAGPAQ